MRDGVEAGHLQPATPRDRDELAVGAIGTVLTAVAAGFLALKWWQMPLALVGKLNALALL